MNLTIRLGLIACVTLTLAVGRVFAQATVDEKLRRADTQFDLYAYFTALTSYNDVLAMDPTNAYAHGRIADCYFQLNRPADALPWYDRAAQLGRVDPEILFRYGQALMHTGDYVGARKWFNSYAQTNPAVGQHFVAMCDQIAQIPSGVYQVKNELINSPSADYSPVLYGNRVIFSSASKEIKRKSPKGEGNSGGNELFISQRNLEDGLLQRPGFLLADLQKSPSFNEGPVAYSGSGSRVAFCHNKFVDGTRQLAAKGMEMSLYIAEVNADGKWASAQPFQYNGSDYAVGFPWLSDDGNTLYFASNMSGGMGGWDLYQSIYNPSTRMWGTPRNLGATINTPGNEITPSMVGTTLYFSSDWHAGIGGLDVFRADFQNNYASSVQNMGTGLNSSRDDYGFVWDDNAKVGYLTSNRSEGRGNEDIWKVTQGLDEFTITVRDAYQQPVANAEIDFSACGKNIVTRTDETGRYAFRLASNKANCSATIRKAGYATTSVLINSYGERNLNVVLTAPNAAVAPAPNAYNTPSNTAWTPLGTQQTASLPPVTPNSGTSTNDGWGSWPSNSTPSNPVVSQPVITTPPSPSWNASGSEFGGSSVTTTTPAPTVSTDWSLTNPPVSAPTVSGYSIQLAAIPGEVLPSRLAKYDDLTSYGNVYSKPDNGTTRIRLGIFPTKSAAESILKKVQKKEKKAFVVEENNADATLAVAPTNELNEVAPNTYDIVATQKGLENKPAPVPALPAAPPVIFAIQIGTIGGQEPFVMNQYADLASYGNLYTRPDNDVQRIRVGVWESQADAESAQAQIMARGYKNAVVVVEKLGAEIPKAGTLAPTPSMTPEAPEVVPAAPEKVNKMPENKTPKSVTSTPTSAANLPSLESSSAADLPALDGSAPVVYDTPAKTSKSMLVIKPDPTGAQYMVRICSLTGDPSKFDVKKAEKAGGTVDARISPSGATIMLLTNFADQESAMAAKSRLVTMGFPDAMVVKELNKDGILRKVE
jgi:tetratricopeptide (TPR) repeat protein